MDRFGSKTGFPAVYPTDGLSTAQPSKARRIAVFIAKALLGVVFIAFALVLIYQVIHDKQEYDDLLIKYNDLLAEQGTQTAGPVATLAHRAEDPASQSYVYTTTTVTEGTTVTIQTTASSSSIPASTPVFASSGSVSTSVSSGPCFAITVTETVTVGASSAVSSSSSQAPETILETRVTTSTVFVTASGLVTPKAQTLTLTATATELKTSTEVATIGGGNQTSSGTSTSTAEGVQGTSVPASSGRLTHFPNTTSILAPYNTGGVAASTASYTLTVPPGITGAVGSTGAGAPPGTTTSQVDPVSATAVTVSGAAKAGAASVGMAFAVIFAVALCI